MVAVDSGGHGKICNGTALGGLAGAISANGVAQHTGCPDRAVAVLIGAGNIDSLGQSLCCNAGDAAAVLPCSAAGQLKLTGGIGGAQNAVCVIVSLGPVVQGNA